MATESQILTKERMSNQLVSRLPRRTLLQAGALGLLGLDMTELRAIQAAHQLSPNATAKSVLFIFLSGGLSQLDSLDMKPDVMARRLIDAGVTLVQANLGNYNTWDLHGGIFKISRDWLYPPADQAISALLQPRRYCCTLLMHLHQWG